METPGTSRSFKTLGLSTDDLPRQRKYEEHSGSIDIDDESKLLSVFPEEVTTTSKVDYCMRISANCQFHELIKFLLVRFG